MQKLEEISEQIHTAFEAHTAVRDKALTQTRTLTRHCAKAIRAIHRDESDTANEHIQEAQKLVEGLRTDLAEFPSVFYAGYTQDALKEYSEANLVMALVTHSELPSPQDLGLESAAYLKGMAEAAGELRRRCLDILRQGHSQDSEKLLGYMNEIYTVLVTMDYPDAVTGGLRRLTDICRAVTERTRGDVTLSLRQERLEERLLNVEASLEKFSNLDSSSD